MSPNCARVWRHKSNYKDVIISNDRILWKWDLEKDRSNLQRHRVGFQTAAGVFSDPLAATLRDPYPDEERWRTMGLIGGVVVVVVHTDPTFDEAAGAKVGRIISARKATRRERRAYEEGS